MTRSERCLAQAEVFKARAFLTAITALAEATSGGEWRSTMKLAQRHIGNMDEATNNALSYGAIEESND